MFNKIHILGGPGSGKSYIALKLSKLLNINTINLDNLFWDYSSKSYNKKKNEKIRDKELKNILKEKSWIIEGVYYNWLEESFKQSNCIIILDTPVYIRMYRILKRFILRKFKIIKSNKKETLKTLIDLLKWNNNFDNDNLKRILNFIEPYNQKILKFKDSSQAEKYFINLMSKN